MRRLGARRLAIELNRGRILADDHTSGLSSALDAAIDAAGPMRLPLADVETLDLFTDADAAARDPREAARQALEAGRRAGRPRGSSNKRTAKWRDYLTSRYAHPLEVLASTISRTPAELAAELGCTRLEAFQLQQRAAAELAPYMESKMPTLAHVAMDSGLTILMPGVNAPIGATMADLERLAELDPDMVDLDVIEHVLALAAPGAKVDLA